MKIMTLENIGNGMHEYFSHSTCWNFCGIVLKNYQIVI